MLRKHLYRPYVAEVYTTSSREKNSISAKVKHLLEANVTGTRQDYQQHCQGACKCSAAVSITSAALSTQIRKWFPWPPIFYIHNKMYFSVAAKLL